MSLSSAERAGQVREKRPKKGAKTEPALAYEEFAINPDETWGASAQGKLTSLQNVLSHTLFHSSVEFLGNESMWSGYKANLSASAKRLDGFDLTFAIKSEYARLAAILGIPRKSVNKAFSSEENLRALIRSRVEAEHAAHGNDWNTLIASSEQLDEKRDSFTASARNLAEMARGKATAGGDMSNVFGELSLLERRVIGTRNPETRNIEGGILSRMDEVRAITAKENIFPEDIERAAALIAETRKDLASIRSRITVKEEQRIGGILKEEKGILKKDSGAAFRNARAAAVSVSKILTEMNSAITRCSRRAERFTQMNKTIEDVSAIAPVLEETEDAVNRQIAKLNKGYQRISYKNEAHKRKIYSRGNEFLALLIDFKKSLPEFKQETERFAAVIDRNAA